MSSPAVAFDQRQARFWERDESYTDPANATAVAAAAPKIDFLQRRLALPRSASVLEVGAGNGVFTRQLLRHFDRVVSTDIAWNMLARNCPDASRMRASAYELPFRDGSFDLVFCANLLHHVADPLRVAREMARVAGRHVAFCEPNRWNLPLLLYMAIVPIERGGVKFCPSYLRRLADAADIETLSCDSMGLVYERSTPAFMLPWLRPFDRPSWFGAYTLLTARKRGPG
jgi:SAM-dependent methyltransferase